MLTSDPRCFASGPNPKPLQQLHNFIDAKTRQNKRKTFRIDLFGGLVAGQNKYWFSEAYGVGALDRILVGTITHLIELHDCEVSLGVLVKKNKLSVSCWCLKVLRVRIPVTRVLTGQCLQESSLTLVWRSRPDPDVPLLSLNKRHQISPWIRDPGLAGRQGGGHVS